MYPLDAGICSLFTVFYRCLSASLAGRKKKQECVRHITQGERIFFLFLVLSFSPLRVDAEA